MTEYEEVKRMFRREGVYYVPPKEEQPIPPPPIVRRIFSDKRIGHLLLTAVGLSGFYLFVSIVNWIISAI